MSRLTSVTQQSIPAPAFFSANWAIICGPRPAAPGGRGPAATLTPPGADRANRRDRAGVERHCASRRNWVTPPGSLAS